MASSDKPSTKTGAKVQTLSDMLQYQDGSIVSKVLMKNPAASVTLFAFEKGEGLSEHTTPSDALILVLDGEASICVDGMWHTVHAGETINLPSNVPHAVKATSRFKMILTMIRS